jgi:hypothetical protein
VRPHAPGFSARTSEDRAPHPNAKSHMLGAPTSLAPAQTAHRPPITLRNQGGNIGWRPGAGGWGRACVLGCACRPFPQLQVHAPARLPRHRRHRRALRPVLWPGVARPFGVRRERSFATEWWMWLEIPREAHATSCNSSVSVAASSSDTPGTRRTRHRLQARRRSRAQDISAKPAGPLIARSANQSQHTH